LALNDIVKRLAN